MASFASYITAYLHTEFKWGEHDCCTFTVGWLKELSGEDYLAEHRPWNSEKEAMEIIKRLGGLRKIFNKTFDKVPVNFACDGDLTIYKKAACIFNGRYIVTVGKSGLVYFDRSLAKKAWRCRELI